KPGGLLAVISRLPEECAFIHELHTFLLDHSEEYRQGRHFVKSPGDACNGLVNDLGGKFFANFHMYRQLTKARYTIEEFIDYLTTVSSTRDYLKDPHHQAETREFLQAHTDCNGHIVFNWDIKTFIGIPKHYHAIVSLK